MGSAVALLLNKTSPTLSHPRSPGGGQSTQTFTPAPGGRRDRHPFVAGLGQEPDPLGGPRGCGSDALRFDKGGAKL